MPLVRIDLHAGREPETVRAIADAAHAAIVQIFGIPARDRFQIVTEHAADQLVAEDAGLGFERSAGLVIIHVFTQRGRSAHAKQMLYAAIADSLATVGVAGEDVFIGYCENGAEDWSFGFGRAQYLTGELGIPAAAG